MHPARMAAMQAQKASEQSELLSSMCEKIDLIMAHLGIEEPDHEESDAKDSDEGGDDEGGPAPEAAAKKKATTETRRARHRKA